jgi:tripartite-type tricarboxylate transporter receptor subunit TctC
MLRTLTGFALITLSALSTTPAQAQTWPDKPVKIVVPYAAGGGADILARVMADQLSDAFGQRFIVENRPGAGGMIGAETVAKSAPDGYALLVSSPAEIAINQHVYKTMNYDPVKDLAPITLIAWTPLVITAHPDLKVASPSELIALLKTRRGQLTYSSPGVGSAQHLAGELLKETAGVDMRHVAYRGAAPAVQDAVAGHVPITISGIPPVLELIKSNRLRAVAITSAKRSHILPNTPALAELGSEFATVDIANWFGFFAPAGVSDDIRQKLHQAAVKALRDPTVRQRIAEQGAEAVGNTPEEFAAFIAAESAKYSRIAKLIGVRVEEQHRR